MTVYFQISPILKLQCIGGGAHCVMPKKWTTKYKLNYSLKRVIKYIFLRNQLGLLFYVTPIFIYKKYSNFSKVKFFPIPIEKVLVFKCCYNCPVFHRWIDT